VQVVGLELDPARVAAAAPYADPPRTSFRCGGFELPLGGRSPVLVRAFNVLRQYDESEVPAAWARLTSALAPGGMVIEGTCGKIGRRACWVALDRSGPHTLTLAAHLPSLACPSELAPRLPKCLIHHNVPGEPVHELLVALDRAWARAAPLAVFGPRCRWVETVAAVAAAGWPVRGRRARWRAGEITVDWAAVAPSCSAPGRRGRAGASRAAG
jgi:hypothetical protein